MTREHPDVRAVVVDKQNRKLELAGRQGSNLRQPVLETGKHRNVGFNLMRFRLYIKAVSRRALPARTGVLGPIWLCLGPSLGPKTISTGISLGYPVR